MLLISLRLVEENWDLGNLGRCDAPASPDAPCDPYFIPNKYEAAPVAAHYYVSAGIALRITLPTVCSNASQDSPVMLCTLV